MANVITFDGMDVDQNGEWLAVPFIHVWKQYNPRNEIVAAVPHGAEGELLEHKGSRCKVRVGDIVGFVTFWFIKELKGKWLEERKGQAA